jgi:hypothetical protein
MRETEKTDRRAEVYHSDAKVPVRTISGGMVSSLWGPAPADLKNGILAAPESLLEFLWGDSLPERPEEDQIQARFTDEDHLNAVFDLSALYQELYDLRYGYPAHPGNRPDVPGDVAHPGKPGRPDLVPQEWLDWVADNAPGLLFCSAYSGCV